MKNQDTSLNPEWAKRIKQVGMRAFEVEEMLQDYSHVEEFIWAQEEPRNQGAWFSHRHRLERVLNKLNIENSFKPISRPAAAAPAVGLMKLHLQQQQELVDNVLKRDNK